MSDEKKKMIEGIIASAKVQTAEVEKWMGDLQDTETMMFCRGYGPDMKLFITKGRRDYLFGMLYDIVKTVAERSGCSFAEMLEKLAVAHYVFSGKVDDEDPDMPNPDKKAEPKDPK